MYKKCNTKWVYMSKLGDKIKQLRESKNITQQELAKMVDINQTSISKFESGQRNPTPANLKKIAEALCISPNEFIEDNNFEKNVLMRNLKGLSSESLKKINEYTEFIKAKEMLNKND